jgi:hypothetical protein
MPFQLSPGVSVTEKDITLIVPAVATTSAAIVAPFVWGPGEVVTVISNEKELLSTFGEPFQLIDNPWAAKFWLCASNFLAYGNNLKVVRHIEDETNAFTQLSGAALPEDPNGIQIPNETIFKNYEGTFPISGYWTSVTGFVARYPGKKGNSLRVVILDHVSSLPSETDIADYTDYIGNFDGIPDTSPWAIKNGFTNAKDEIHILVIDQDGWFTGTRGTILEKYSFVSKALDALTENGTTNYYAEVINRDSKYIYAINDGMVGETVDGVTVLGWGIRLTGSDLSVRYAYLNHPTGFWAAEFENGEDYTYGTAATSSNKIVATFTDYFGDPEAIDVSLFIAGPLTSSAADDLIQLAESRKDCIAFVSPETDAKDTMATNLETALEYRADLTASSYGVMDSGYKLQYNKYEKKYMSIPLCGDIAGCCARTDQDKDPWFSPAGFDRGRIKNAIRLAYSPNKTHRDELYKKSINPVTYFEGSGIVLFGDKTLLEKPSAFDRINVRRLFIVLEKAIATASKFLLFEFNDEFTRSQFKLLVEPYLREVVSRRGIQDFKVVCDETNNTGQVVDSNSFVADIYIKPNRSINFIQLNFIATPSGVSFEEVVGA